MITSDFDLQTWGESNHILRLFSLTKPMIICKAVVLCTHTVKGLFTEVLGYRYSL